MILQHKTNIQLELNKNFVFPETPKENKWIKYKNPSEVLSADFLKTMEAIGFPVRSLTIFYCPPFCNPTHAHIDISAKENIKQNFAFNYVIGGKNSKMVWYKPLVNENYEPLEEITEINPMTGSRGEWPKYLANWQIAPDTLEQIEEASIQDHLTLVNVGTPHAVFTDAEDRWCVSLRFHDDHIVTWDEICEIMRAKNLLWT